MREQSRRSVLGVAVLSTLALATPPVPASAAPSQAPLRLVRSAFTPHVGRRFTLSRPGATTTARLYTVEDLRQGSRPNDPHRFSLLFRASERLPGGQGVFRLRLGGVGSVDLFVVPVDRGVRGQHHYQAIVNRRSARFRRPGRTP